MFSPATHASDGSGNRFIFFLPFAAAYTILFALTCRNPFFLDKDILFSKIAFWLTENHFSPVLPDSIDPGYPPSMGYMLAGAWSLFGRSLFVSHAIILPFTLGMIWQSHRFVSLMVPEKAVLPAMLIIMADSTLLSQSTLYSADMVLLFFFLLAINSLIRNRRIWLAIAATGLLFTHMRGSFLLVAAFLFDQFSTGSTKNLTARFRKTLSYFPAIFLFGLWLIYHQVTKGWTGYAPDSPWEGSLEAVDLNGFLKNLFVVAWRMADHGKIFVYVVLLYLVKKLRNTKPENRKDVRDLLLLLSFVLLTTIPSMLMYSNLSGHRYFMAINFTASAIVASLIFSERLKPAFRKTLMLIITAGLLSGNFWVYPDKIAKGWDASLAYLPYHHLRNQMISYLVQHDIPFEDVGTESPNTIVFKYIDLTDDERSFKRASLDRDRYVFWSNVYNMFTDEELDALKSNWVVEKELRCMQVVVRLYRNPYR